MQRDEAGVENLDLEGLNELNGNLIAELSELKRLYWFAWNLQKDLKLDVDEKLDAQCKRVKNNKKFNEVSSNLVSEITSCAQSYVERILPAVKNCAKVCECFRKFLAELRDPCQKSFESARSMKIISSGNS